ncbi:hypothetical protein J19TS2_24650 [Cohnella xylanilytica]|uniref:NAD-dependent epimerase/dehydratase family protein n=1 Tax=Cohnella xylanilytica TaxID=557555 RepID=A0A841TTM5_9BACL|nr:NAD-dependent epimerase/dehydratase family protein [Cohnella xylanilytica]MBB6691525.1 NAD-dependent epimerase/dehydratase family protein [Cohnella xylanilytica]GIO12910.1 hypothetical protein J19TS2_24650 [Cohnella xylanilytica]
MKVLITGGYGFIGSTIAERFHKEGHDIYVIDDLSTGRKEHLTVPHKAYLMDVADPSCDEVFASVAFDVVIHLAAQVDVATSMREPVADTRTNVLGLVNILNCAAKHGVKKLIFASSAAVYGNAERIPVKEEDAGQTQSVYGLNKWLGELYCGRWGDYYGLKTLCFRFANVYGPKQGNGGEGGVVSIFLEAALRGEPIQVFGDGTQTRDFIYVGDIADAVLRGATSDASGVMNLSTGRETSINELIGIVREFHPIPEPEYRDPRPGDIGRSCLDNETAKKTLDWVPLFTVREGLEITYEWAASRSARQALAAERKPRRSWHKRVRKLRGYAENIILLGILVAYMTASPYSVPGTGAGSVSSLYFADGAFLWNPAVRARDRRSHCLLVRPEFGGRLVLGERHYGYSIPVSIFDLFVLRPGSRIR